MKITDIKDPILQQPSDVQT